MSHGSRRNLPYNSIGRLLTVVAAMTGPLGLQKIVLADEPAEKVEQKVEQPDIVLTTEYWLGVKCSTLSDELRDSLKLDKEIEGIVVHDVYAKGPAARPAWR